MSSLPAVAPTVVESDTFASIGKERFDFFDDGFFNSKKLIVKVKNSAGVAINFESDIEAKGNMASSISSSYKTGNSVSLDKFRVKSDGRISLEACMKLNDSVKLTVAAEDSRQEPGKPVYSFGKLGFEYKVPLLGILAADVDVVNNYSLRSSVVTNYNAFKFGAQCVVSGKTRENNTHLEHKQTTGGLSDGVPELLDLSFVSAYKGAGWDASVITRNFLKSLRVSYIQTLSPTVDVGAQVDYGILVNSHKFNIGAKMAIDEKSQVKAKLDTAALLSSSFTQKLSDKVTMTVCAAVDISNWSADSHKFGFGLTFE